MSRFAPGEVVWAKNAFHRNVYWPAIVADVERDAPPSLRRSAVSGRVCLMFYGPSSKPNMTRDWYCREERDILPWEENFESMQRQEVNRKEETAFRTAIIEGQTAIRGQSPEVLPAQEGSEMRTPRALLRRHGPSSVSRNTMGLCCICHEDCEDLFVTCRKCAHRVHVECDVLAIVPSRAEAAHRSCIYFCPNCRSRGMETKEQRQFVEDYRAELPLLKTGTLEGSTSQIKEEIEAAATKDECNQLYSIVHREFNSTVLQFHKSSVGLPESSTRKKYIKMATLHKRSTLKAPDSHGTPSVEDATQLVKSVPPDEQLERPVPSARLGGGSPHMGSLPLSGGVESGLMSLDDLQIQREIPVECNGVTGMFLFGEQRVVCSCNECSEKPENDRIFTATHFEQHCGAGSAKKWKASVRIRPGGVPEVSLSDPPLPLGRWFVMKGIDELVTRVPVSSRRKDGSRSTKRQAAYPNPAFAEFKRSHQPEAKPWDQVRVGGYMKIHVKYAGDRCSICDADIDYDCDQLISCDKCGITVHQTCYGVHEKVSNDHVWLCNVCRAQGTENAECCLCPVAEGARKPTTIPGLWCHVACMQWIPEVTVVNPMQMEPVSRIECIQKERWELNCCFCKQKMGAKIQCTACYTSYHPLCARIAGMHMEMKDGPQGPAGPLDLITFCPRHATPHPELSGIKLAFDHDEDSGGMLFNRQPYPEARAMSVPIPPAGCARAQPIGEWERKSHGSGSGYGTVKAFWIPLRPKMDDFGNYVHPDGTPIDPQVIPRFRKRRSKGTHRRSRNKAMKLDENDDDAISPVELMPMPEGVPETVIVECNGVRGLFHVRCQRVSHQDVIIPAARFETLCGRGDAKKWKSSLWYVNEESNAAEAQMSTWLARVGLDRKMLFALRENYQDHEVYETHVKNQVTRVVSRIVDSVCCCMSGEEQPRNDADLEERDSLPDEAMQDPMRTPLREERMEEASPSPEDAISDDAAAEASPLSEQMICSEASSEKELSESPEPQHPEASNLHSDAGHEDDMEMESTFFGGIEPLDESVSDGEATDKDEYLKPYGAEIIGKSLALWSADGSQYLQGNILRYRETNGDHCITFEDGNEEWIDLNAEDAMWNAEESIFTLQRRQPESSQQLEEEQDLPASSIELPEKIEVFCKEFRAMFLVKEKMILSDQGLRMTPRDFERAAGKGAAKKWKNSIKVKKPEGNGMMTLGEWLIRNGCLPETSKSVRQRRATSRSNMFQRSRASRVGDIGWLAPKHRKQRHQAGCQCIVCRQSRRRASDCNLTGRMEKMDSRRVEKWQPATTLAALRAHGPGIRYGKRAYVRAVPQIVGGITRHEPHEVPPSKCWNVQDWLRHVQTQQEGTTNAASTQNEIMCKTAKWKSQLQQCNQTEDQRVAFGKSGIHGWGLFALVNHKQDEMIIEYKGEIVTPAVADMREKQYRENQKDCYLFHVNDSFIIDATVKGSIARFINHCCEPCMYCKDIQVDGRHHLCFFARYDIKAGQELTYDYRFKEEVEENKLICNCGAPNCRGFLN